MQRLKMALQGQWRGCRLAFVHGFNNTPEEIAERMATIQALLPAHVALSGQEWTSVAGLARRRYGVPDAAAAMLYPIDNYITNRLAGRNLWLRPRMGERLCIVAHSRGCAVTTHWLMQDEGRQARVHRVAFLHPDVDEATFEKLPETFRHEKVKVFDTKGDYATSVSGAFDGGRDLMPYVRHSERAWVNLLSHNYWLDDRKALKQVLDWLLDD